MAVAGSDTMTITSQKLPEPGRPAAAPTADTLAPAGAEVKTLSRYDPDLRTTLTAKVEVTPAPDNLLLGETGHPLIDYDAVYPGRQENGNPVPVLGILRTVPARGATPYEVPKSLLPDRTSQDLESGIIPADFRQRLADKGLNLTVAATVTDEHGPAWLITDQGQTYLVTRGEASFTAVKATVELVYSDLTAIITGPNAGRFPTGQDGPSFKVNPASPDRRQPYREYTIIYHMPGGSAVQAFDQFSNPNLAGVLTPGMDLFAINYGVAGIGARCWRTGWASDRWASTATRWT